MKALNRWIVVWLAALLAVSGASVFATGQQEPGPTAETVEVVKVGGVYPMTGPFAPFGIGDKQAIELAVEEINENGGIKSLGGAKIEMIFADSEGDPKVAMTAAERLIVKDGVTAILGSVLSGTTASIAPVCERYQTPMVNEGSTSITLTQNNWKYFFRTTPHDGLYCEAMFDFLKEIAAKSGERVKTIGLMYENTLFGKTAGDVWKAEAADYGFSIVADISYSAQSVDLSSEILNLKRAAPDVIFLASYTQDAILITKTRQSLNCNAKLVVGINGGQIVPSYIEALGPLANFVSAEARWSPDINKEIAQKVNAKYRERYGTNMDGHNARAHTALLTLYYALEEAGSTDKEKLREALAGIYVPPEKIIMTWKGVRFDETGQNVLGTPCIVQIQDGEFRTVYPYDIASSEIVFPVAPWSERTDIR
ncbi:MAG: ABC transporter substrate-binding protein [Spirochaetales bacterium]|nr:ABC transporter substrate-binding protein [Spirochaetales bacterium]